MGAKWIVLLWITFSSGMLKASILGEENILLIELVTTTASQLNELERLVSSANKYTKKMQEYNELFQDEYFKAEQVAYLAEEIASKKEIQNLDGLNSAIRKLKYSMSDLKKMMVEYSLIKSEEKKVVERVKQAKKLNQLSSKRAARQISHSITSSTTGRSTQLTAQNTALMNKKMIDLHNTQLEILKGVSTTNRLIAEQLEDKRLAQIQKERSYGQISRGAK